MRRQRNPDTWQLLCGQLDVDRLEYLCRDSFFTGVREGNIGSARIIAMLNVINDRLVADSKGIYSIENYLTTRRLMYWQVYLHKTAIAGELVLQSVIKRAQELARKGTDLYSTPALWHFLHTDISRNCFFNDPIHFERFMELDDSDIWTAIKQWQHHPDIILQTLAKDFINRNLFKVEILDTPIPHQRLENLRKKIAEQMDISVQEANYLIQTRTVEKEMYSNAADGITLLYPDGSLREVTTVSELINSDSAERKNARHYLFFQRWPTN